MDRQLGCKRKYKSYTYHGNVSVIPDRTQRSWAARKRREKCSNSRTDVAGPSDQNEDLEIEEPPEKITPDDTQNEAEDIPFTEDMTGEPKFLDDNDNEFSSEVESEDDIIDETSTSGNPDSVGNESGNNPSSSLSGYPTEQLIPTLLALTFKLRHNLSYSATEDALLLAKVLTDARIAHASKYYWKKISNSLCDFLSIHHFCAKCNNYIGKEVGDSQNNQMSLRCPRCDCVLFDSTINWKNGNVVLSLTLKYQIEYFLEMNHEKLINPNRRKKNKYALEDIFDGRMYKMWVTGDSVTLNFNVDGTPIYKSSPTCIYPVLCTINEFPAEERGKDMILSSLWFGEGKPKNINEFLKPFVAELQDLSNNGLTYSYQGKVYHKKFQVLVGICDSIARPVVRNSSQFNGEYGCGLCLHPGIQVVKGGGTVRVYPIDRLGNPFGEGLRNHDETLIHAINHEKGIKSRSVLYDAPGFNVINGLPADWMHLATLGVAKQFCKIWFDSTYRDRPFSLGKHEALINGILESFSPTLEISRTTRAISQPAFWKAHEWSVWLLFYSLPILIEITPRAYVDHWVLFVDGLSILLKTSIMPSEVEYARQCLYSFVKGVEELYGIEHVSFNVHLLTHLPDSVLNWGPLWTHSAFIYESFNFILKKAVHSSNGVPLQITDAFRYQVAIIKLRSICEEHLSYSQKKFVSGMLNRRIRPKFSVRINDIGVLGRTQRVGALSRPSYSALRRLNVYAEDASTIDLALRISMNNEIFHSKQYKRPQKRKSYIVISKDREVFEIEEFVILSYTNHQECYAIGQYYERSTSLFSSQRRLSHLTFVKKKDDDLAAINVCQIKEKVILVQLLKKKVFIACTHPNKFESWK